MLEEEVGKFPLARRIFWPVRCMHCEDPACLDVCPTGATTQREDKIVQIDTKKCVGCKACILACPYDARTLWEGNNGYFQNALTPYEKVTYANYIPRTVQKCDFCADRIAQGRKPYCVETCLTGALIFGDLDDPKSEVNKALAEGRIRFRLKEELGTKPSIYYLAF